MGNCIAPSAGISTGKGLRYPQPLAEVAVETVGVFSGEGCWAPSAFSPKGMLWLRGSPLAPGPAVGTLVVAVIPVSDM